MVPNESPALFIHLFTQFSFLGMSRPWELQGCGMKPLLEASPSARLSWHCLVAASVVCHKCPLQRLSSPILEQQPLGWSSGMQFLVGLVMETQGHHGVTHARAPSGDNPSWSLNSVLIKTSRVKHKLHLPGWLCPQSPQQGWNHCHELSL